MWAPYWYDGVHKSKGFYADSKDSGNEKGTYRPSAYQPLKPEQLEAYREALPFYELLKNRAVAQDVLSKGLTHCPPDKGSALCIDDSSKSIIDHGKTVTISTDAPDNSPSLSLTDSRNANVLIWVGDQLLPREYARVSVFDSSVQGGDAVWEGMRVYGGRVFMMEEHLDRLFDSAHSMDYAGIPSREYIAGAIFNTLRGR